MADTCIQICVSPKPEALIPADNMGVGIVTNRIPLWPLCNHTIRTPPNPILMMKAPTSSLEPSSLGLLAFLEPAVCKLAGFMGRRGGWGARGWGGGGRVFGNSKFPKLCCICPDFSSKMVYVGHV